MYSNHKAGGPHLSQHQTRGTSRIGLPVHFVTGQFAGQTIRAELEELQKADLGRKFGSIDRRPLDPPIVVALRLFSRCTAEDGTVSEKEVDYDEIQTLGLLCTVDLFPVPGVDPERPHRGSTNHAFNTQYTFIQSPVYPQRLSATSHAISQSSLPVSNVVHHIGDIPITEDSKRTPQLVGSLFVQPVRIDWQGKKQLMFVFSDLAVKAEGTFILRYRVFDIFSKPEGYDDLIIQAECFGGTFHVFSTKEFPGLQASTELTKHIARYGVKLNLRETERKRKKKSGEGGSTSPPSSSHGKRKYDTLDNESDS